MDISIKAAQGIAEEKRSKVLAIRYTPTIVSILLGFTWKALISDLNLITPWSTISRQQKLAQNSILLNYVDSLDIINVWTSFRQQHWALLLASVCGLLVGAITPLANALTYTDLNAYVAFDTQLYKDTTFIFNGSLALLMDWRSTQPVEAYHVGLYAPPDNGTILPWSATGLTFESFNWPGAKGFDNFNITVRSEAFSAYLSCGVVEYTSTHQDQEVNSTITLQGHGHNCSAPILQQIKLPYNSTNVWDHSHLDAQGNWRLNNLAWSNITNCDSPDDWRILTTLLDVQLQGSATYAGMDPETVASLLDPNARWNMSMAGLICKPTYMLTPAIVVVNGTSGWIMDFDLYQNETRYIDIGISTELVHAQIEDPLGLPSQHVFEAAATNDWQSSQSLPNSYNWSIFPQLEVMQRWSWLYLWTANRDAFFFDIVKDVAGFQKLKSDINLFQSTVNRHFSIHMAQIIHFGARATGEGHVTGSVQAHDSRLLIRQESLRILQAVLIGLAAVVTCCATILRPRTVLSENPASLSVVAVILALSKDADKCFQELKSSGDGVMRNKVKDFDVRLTRTLYSCAVLEIMPQRGAEDRSAGQSEDQDLKTRSQGLLQRLLPRIRTRVPLLGSRVLYSSKDRSLAGRYRPFALRLLSRWSITIFLLLAALAVGVLLHLSQSRNGFQHPSTVEGDAWSYVPTSILVLIGYGVQGIQSSVFNLERFHTLQSKKATGRDALFQKRITIPHRQIQKRPQLFSLLWLSCLLLAALFPAIKIVVGGLYRPEYAPYSYPGNNTFDRAPFDNFYNLTRNLSLKASSDLPFYGAYYTEATMPPDSVASAGYYYPVEWLGTLNIPLLSRNFTAQIPDSGASSTNLAKSTFHVRTIAVKTDIECYPSKESDFMLLVTGLGDGYYRLTWDCASSHCESHFKPAFNHANLSLKILQDGNITAEAEPWYYSIAYPSLLDSSITILLTDFTNLTGPLNNLSSLCTNGTRPVTQADLGISLPPIRGAHCTRTVERVYVNITYAAKPEYLNIISTGPGSLVERDWIPRSYDAASIEPIDILDPTNPPAGLLPNGGAVEHHYGSFPIPQRNLFSVLALIGQSQEVRTGSKLGLFGDVEELVASAKQVYQLFSRYALAYSIGAIRNRLYHGANATYPENITYPDQDFAHVDGEFAIYREVFKQDPGSSVALIVLLLAVAALVVYISIVMPRKTILPRAPSSIAAQLSFLAGSRLVKTLREEGVVRTADTNIWDQNVGLGWWPMRDEKPGLRWGIDIGYLDKRSTGLVVPVVADPEGQDTSNDTGTREDFVPMDDPQGIDMSLETHRLYSSERGDDLENQHVNYETQTRPTFGPLDGPEDQSTAYDTETVTHHAFTGMSNGLQGYGMLRHGEFDFERHGEEYSEEALAESIDRTVSALSMNV